jgi:CRISPR-associated protein Cas5h
MLSLSFILEGDFAAFKDPSITTNQVVYYIPSKSSLIGTVAAIIGVNRSHTFDELYSKEYIDLIRKINVGIELCSEPKKITYYTNHRSLKESKTKPFKKEILQFPRYRIYLNSNSENLINEIYDRIKSNKYEYYPYLGHAYCPARLRNPIMYYKSEECSGEFDEETEIETPTTILDESENYSNDFEVLKVDPIVEDSSIMVERHLHHFYHDDRFQKRVLKFWIPVNSAYSFVITKKPVLSKYIKLENDSENDLIVCFY